MLMEEGDQWERKMKLNQYWQKLLVVRLQFAKRGDVHPPVVSLANADSWKCLQVVENHKEGRKADLGVF